MADPHIISASDGTPLLAWPVSATRADGSIVTGYAFANIIVGTAPGDPGGPIADSNSAAFGGEVAMTVGTAYPAGRSLKINCAAAGNVVVTYADGSTGAWAVAVGIQTLPIAATSIVAAGTTATATYFNLK